MRNVQGHMTISYVDGFDSPVGTPMERLLMGAWPNDWFDANPYGTFFTPNQGQPTYHTGADLNRPNDTDAHKEVYSIANGLVIFSDDINQGNYGGIIVIKHWLPVYDRKTGYNRIVFSRFQHVENIQVSYGHIVMRGDHIANIGNAHGVFGYHLHFDISESNILSSNPLHWPGADKKKLTDNYTSPQYFINSNRPAKIKNYQVTEDNVHVRKTPWGKILGTYNKGQKLTINGVTATNDSKVSWGRIIGKTTYSPDGYIAMSYLREIA